MNSFETYLTLPACVLPAAYVRHLAQSWDCTFGPDDDVDDVPVLVEHEGGWYEPAKTWGRPEDCYPADGEDPEIVSVVLNDPEFASDEDLLAFIGGPQMDDLVRRAWDDIETSRRYGDY